MEWGVRYEGSARKGVGVLITGHRIPVSVLSIGCKFTGCLKVGPSN